MSLRAKAFLRPLLAAFILLLIPAAAMQFTTEVDWSLSDFIIAGALIFCTGLAFEVVFKKGGNTAYRVAFGIAAFLTLALIWANLAVGFVGSGPNLPNLLLGLVPFVGVIGSITSHLRPRGMARTMFAMAAGVMLAPAIGLVVNRPPLDGGVAAVLAISACIAALYTVCGLLFRHAGGAPASTGRLA